MRRALWIAAGVVLFVLIAYAVLHVTTEMRRDFRDAPVCGARPLSGCAAAGADHA